MNPPPELLKVLQEEPEFIVVGHEEPDGDCIGSQLALASLLERMGKKVTRASSGPFGRREIRAYAPRFREEISALDRKNRPWVLILDCASLERVGKLSSQLQGLPLAVIDHHATESVLGDVRYVDSSQAANTLLIMKIFQALGESPTAEEASFLFLGLCTDTGFFRHLTQEQAQVFQDAGWMVSHGASPKSTFSHINGGRDLAATKLNGLILSRTESHCDGALLLTYELLQDREKLGVEKRASDEIYQALQSIQGVEVVVLLREESPGRCTGGLRSLSKVNVAAIAEELGGGGHFHAAGFLRETKLKDLKKELVHRISRELPL